MWKLPKLLARHLNDSHLENELQSCLNLNQPPFYTLFKIERS